MQYMAIFAPTALELVGSPILQYTEPQTQISRYLVSLEINSLFKIHTHCINFPMGRGGLSDVNTTVLTRSPRYAHINTPLA